MTYKDFLVPGSICDESADLSNEDFRAAMRTLDASLDVMAERLGVGRRMVAYYRKDMPIPKSVALATRYLLSLAIAPANGHLLWPEAVPNSPSRSATPAQ
jgi:hypothetical protein